VVRYVSIDIMRALAIIFMVVCHAVIYLSSPNSGPWVHFLGNHVVGDFAAPFFAFLLGVSQAVSMSKKSTSMNNQTMIKKALTRGGIVVLVGLLFGILAWGPEGLWAWDILPLLGVSLILVACLKNCSQSTILLICAFVVIMAPYGREVFDYQDSWGGQHADVLGISGLLPDFIADPVDDYSPQPTVYDRMQGFFFEGEFPLFPWLCFPLIGFLIGKSIGRHRKRLLIMGSLLSAFGLICAYVSSFFSGYELNDLLITPLSFYPNTTSMIFLQLGLCFMVFSLVQHFDQAKNISGYHLVMANVCSLLSKYSLTIYVMHHFILLWPLWVLGYLHGDVQMYYANASSALFGFVIGGVLLVFLYKIFLIWDKRSGKYSFEWLLQRATS
jgi:uncharacterized protein